MLTDSIFRQDSVVTERINYDLLNTLKEIQTGNLTCPLLLGSGTMSKTKESVPTALTNDC